ncbi:sumo ligase [Colletotrichum plurivorum]|uniref:Sumo ligase n=1 Tax=Colletotrichum plurivorum TaxID=2175906 RepID=A0A8H6KFV9_9PEZI|nr:sumo ligase [Colletotrichum plurivorum]
MTSISRQELQALVKLVQSNQLLNRQLSSICQLNGLTSSGVKASLQSRVVNAINEAFNINDVARFQQIQRSIETARTAAPSPASHKSTRPASTPQPISMGRQDQYWNPRGGRPAGQNGHGHAIQHGVGVTSGPRFKDTPFYELKYRVGDVRVCDTMSQHRNMVSIPVKLGENPGVDKVLDDKSYRIMIFCADSNTNADPQNITFPHQSEIKVNGNEVKANLRGLKNKPGSTRPVDVTSYLRLKTDNRNLVEFTYALTNKKYYLVIYVCKITSAQDLAGRIKMGKRIPKHSVIQEISKKAADTDIVTTSQVLSLKCPLSYMRLDVPCRSTSCSHIQCFDATSYLQLQEQGPQWLCPICNKHAPFDQLAVDEYVKEILANTPKSLDQVTIEPDGQWRVNSLQDDKAANGGSGAFEDDDDDDFIISEVNVVRGRNFETPNRSIASTATPTTTVMSRESSTMPRGLGSTSAKRPHTEKVTIDLTLSDDDEPSVPPPKRQQLQPPGANTHTNGYNGQPF